MDERRHSRPSVRLVPRPDAGAAAAVVVIVKGKRCIRGLIVVV